MSELRCPLHDAALMNPQQPAIIDQNRVYSFPVLDVAATRIHEVLQQTGIREGDRVVSTCTNQWRILPLWMACMRAGAIWAPLSPRSIPADLESAAQRLSATLLVVDSADQPTVGFKHHVVLGETCEETQHAEAVGEPVYDMSLPSTILQTSGSSGGGKSVVHSMQAHYFSALGANQHLPLKSSDKWLWTLPHHHVGGLAILMRCLIAGASVAVPAPGEELGEEVELYRATYLSLVPTQLKRLLEHENSAALARQLKRILVGGASCPPKLFRQALDQSFPVHMTYGMTEMASQVTTVPEFCRPEQKRSSGTLLPFRELSSDEATGEILVRGQPLATGLWKDGQVQPIADEQGWYHTGDTGRLDASGFLHVEGRIDRMFVSGGENIHPEEVERALGDILGVDCVVVSTEHEEWGQAPVAFVDLPEAELEPDMWVDLLRNRLPGYKIPRDYRSMPPQDGLKPKWKHLQNLLAGVE